MSVRGIAAADSRVGAPAVATRQPSVAFLPCADRFEDFHDKIGISLDDFRDGLTGTWLFNYVEAFQAAGVRPVLYFVSARVRGVVRFTHKATGAAVCVLPAPWLHRKLQGARDRWRLESPTFSSVLSYAATPWRALARELRRDGCAAIVCHEYEHPRFDEAVVLGRALHIPVFATFQGANAPRSGLERLFRRAAVRGSAGVMIGGRGEIDRVRSVYGLSPEQIVLMPNTIDVRRWRAVDRRAARTAVGIDQDACVIAWHGRVAIHTKGLDVLLDAWERLCRQRGSAKLLLLLVGSGHDDEQLRRRIAQLRLDNVRWESRYLLDRQLLWRYLSAADIATLPSRHEGFSVTVLEAMACGLPVVAANVSGVSEAFGPEPAGVIVPPENALALADALGRLMDDELRRRDLGARARRRAEQEFSLHAVGTRLRAFMEERGAFSSQKAQ
jgi:glycosyltransferase involved in cell wall biosynthesis